MAPTSGGRGLFVGRECSSLSWETLQMLESIKGFGANSRIHSAHILRLSEDLPLVVEVIDRAERIEELLPIIDEMVDDGLVTLTDIEVVHYRHSSDKDRRSGGSL